MCRIPSCAVVTTTIIRHLTWASTGSSDLTADLGLAQVDRQRPPNVPAGLRPGAARAEGRASAYALARPELLDLLAAAERLLDTTGEQVGLCPVFGQDTGACPPSTWRTATPTLALC